MVKEKVTKEQVSEWIRTLGSTPTEIDEPGSEWHFEIDYPSKSGERVHVVQPKERPFQVVIASGLSVSPSHVKAFDELPASDQTAFSLGLRQVLTRPEVDYQLEGSGSPFECPTHIQVIRNRYADGLTLDSFAESVGFVFKARLQAIYHFQAHLSVGDVGGSGKFDFKRAGL